MEKLPYLAIAPDEPAQPIRLHYRIKKKKVYDLFQRLPYIEYAKDKKAFAWHYTKEVSSKFRHEMPEGIRPEQAVMGYMQFIGNNTLHLTVLSVSRALTAMSFFHQEIKETTMRLVGIDFSNCLFAATEENKQRIIQTLSPFAQHEADIFHPNPRELEELIQAAEDEGKSKKEAVEIAMEKVSDRFQHPLPEFEHFKIDREDTNYHHASYTLVIRHRVAVNRYGGNTEYSIDDAVDELQAMMAKKAKKEEGIND